MNFKLRTLILAILAVAAMIAYGIARHYSPLLVTYVVDQALLQKVPAGMSSSQVHQRFQAFLAKQPDDQKRLEKLLYLSQYLEKTGALDSIDLEKLLGNPGAEEGTGRK